MAKVRLPTAGTVIFEIKKLIATHGVGAFETDGRILLYSGPEWWITKALKVVNNHERGFIQIWDVDGKKSTMIDETPPGQRLGRYDNNKDIYAYFENIYGVGTDEAFYHADKVMRFTSREFAKACYGQVETAVCGAGLNKVFMEVELPELVRNARVKTINGVPMQRIRDIYYSQGAYIAYREVCKAELQLLQSRENSTCAKEIKKDRKDRLQFFRKAMKATFGKIKAGDKAVMQKMAPILPHVVTDKPIRYAVAKTPYVSQSVQYC